MALYNGNTDSCSDCRSCAGTAENGANGTAGTCACENASTGADSTGVLNSNAKELLVFAAIVLLLVALLYRSSGNG